jgi:hypothetical protein
MLGWHVEAAYTLHETIRQRGNLSQWPDRDLLMHGIRVLTRVNDPQVLQTQILQSDTHGACHMWRFAKFDFYRKTPTVRQKQQINFRPTI